MTHAKVALLFLPLLLISCATYDHHDTILPKKSSFSAGAGRIGIAVAKVEPNTYFPGACPLCTATAKGWHLSLTSHANALPVDELHAVKADIAKALKTLGATVTIIDDPIDMTSLPRLPSPAPSQSPVDVSSLASKFGINKLLLVQADSLGFTRQYSGYVPTSQPKAVFDGRVVMVDLGTNAYEWYRTAYVIRSAIGEWDEPPNFPGLTNAYYQALEAAKDRIMKDLAAVSDR